MNIAILSRNPNLYSTSRLLAEGLKRGHQIDVVDHLKCNIVIEKRNPRIYYKDRYLDDVECIIPRIGASATFYGSAVIRQFEVRKVATAIASQALIRSRDKLRSLQLLARSGVGLPKTVFTNYSKSINEIFNEIGSMPLIIKLLEGTQGIGIVLAENKGAATSVIEAFHGLKARFIVQEFIKEAGGADIRALVVGGKVVGAMKRQAKPGEFRSNIHRGGTAMPIRLTKEERTTATIAAKAMGLGIAGVDMLQSNRGPLIMEVNSSPGLEGIEKATQKNIATKIIQYIEKQHKLKYPPKDKVNA